MRRAIVLINVGTPKAPTPLEVGKYLREFLMDRWVLQIPALWRALLVHGLIVPRRKFSSAKKYQKIWTDRGSPLLLHSEELRSLVQKVAGPEVKVLLAMRYGEPRMEAALKDLKAHDAQEVTVVPLFPQFAEATYRSSAEYWSQLWKKHQMKGSYRVQDPFFDQPFFVEALAQKAQKTLDGAAVDHYVMSYHGLPESHIRRTEPIPGHCLKEPSACCLAPQALKVCYRAQCYATSLKLAEALGLSDWSMTFQSRLGRGKWLQPSTEDTLIRLAQKGVKTVAVLSPSFVVDGLETLEEIGMDLKQKFLAAGGRRLILVPCLNDDVTFAEGLINLESGGSEIAPIRS